MPTTHDVYPALKKLKSKHFNEMQMKGKSGEGGVDFFVGNYSERDLGRMRFELEYTNSNNCLVCTSVIE